MSRGELAIALWAIASLAVYVGFCIWLSCKSKSVSLEYDEQQDDQRSQRRY